MFAPEPTQIAPRRRACFERLPGNSAAAPRVSECGLGGDTRRILAAIHRSTLRCACREGASVKAPMAEYRGASKAGLEREYVGPRKSAIHYLEIVSSDVDTLTRLYQRMHGVSVGPPDPDLGQAPDIPCARRPAWPSAILQKRRVPSWRTQSGRSIPRCQLRPHSSGPIQGPVIFAGSVGSRGPCYPYSGFGGPHAGCLSRSVRRSNSLATKVVGTEDRRRKSYVQPD